MGRQSMYNHVCRRSVLNVIIKEKKKENRDVLGWERTRGALLRDHLGTPA